MSVAREYYTLIGSLPYLPDPKRAARSPINRQRLAQRFGSLGEEETRELEGAANLLLWERSVAFDNDAQVVRYYRELLGQIEHVELRRFAEYWMELRTVFAALRRKQLGMGAPTRGEEWGIDPRAMWIERHWDRPDFGLGSVHPWMAEAREHLEAGHAKDLQALQTGLVWRYLDRASQGQPFGFAAVFAYVFKWHLLNRWLSHDPVAATERFRDLVREVCHEFEQDRD
jgi:hypothetical protein